MRIAFVIPYFYPALEYGGTPRIAYDFARALSRRGHFLRILTTDSGGSSRLKPNGTADRQLDGMEVVHYANISNSLAFRQRIFIAPDFLRNASRQLRDVEVAHIHDLRSFLSVSAHKALRSLHVPFVLSPHGGLQHLGKRTAKRIFDGLWGKHILRDASAICAVSPTEEMDAVQFGISHDRIARLPSAINSEAFRELPPRQRTSGRPTILFLGRLNWIKSIDVLIRAFSSFRRSMEADLVIAGPDDGAEPQLRALTKQLDLDRFVTFTGFLNEQQKIQAIVDSDVVVLPSAREGFPVTVLEALACRAPMIVSSACRIEEWISAAGAPDSLITFAAGDSQQLASKIRQVLNGPIPAATLNQRRSVVMTQFSTDALAATAEALYQSVIGRGKSA